MVDGRLQVGQVVGDDDVQRFRRTQINDVDRVSDHARRLVDAGIRRFDHPEVSAGIDPSGDRCDVIVVVRIGAGADNIHVIDEHRVGGDIRLHLHQNVDRRRHAWSGGNRPEVTRQRLGRIARYHAGLTRADSTRRRALKCHARRQQVMHGDIRCCRWPEIADLDVIRHGGARNHRCRRGLGDAQVGHRVEADAANRLVVGPVRIGRCADDRRRVIDIARVQGAECHANGVALSRWQHPIQTGDGRVHRRTDRGSRGACGDGPTVGVGRSHTRDREVRVADDPIGDSQTVRV